MAAAHQLSPEAIPLNFQSKLKELSPDTALIYRRTINDFECFLAGQRLSFSEITPADIADWTTELLRQNLSRATVSQRLNILNSLFKTIPGYDNNPCRTTPRRLARIIEDRAFTLPPLLRAKVAERALLTLRETAKESPRHNILLDILLFAVLNDAIPLRSIVTLKKSDIQNYQGISRRLLERNATARRRFIFDLRQSYLTPKQIADAINDKIRQILPFIPSDNPYTFDILTASLRALIALKAGAPASEAAACATRTASLTIPGFCSAKTDITDEQRQQWDEAIQLLIGRQEPRWYAMHLRRGTDYDDLHREILSDVRPRPELFYPVETIRKKQHGKTTLKEQPFISRIVFFRSNPENVLPMFAKIGDKAWCLRVSGRPGSPYAIIPRRDMERFQNAIGIFTDDTEIHPLGTLAPQPGEKVILIQAGYSNREAEIEDIVEDENGSLLYRVRLTTDYGYEWRATVTPRQLLNHP